MDPVDDMPQFLNPAKVQLGFKDYRIDDVDSWEGRNSLDVSIRVNEDTNISPSFNRKETATVSLSSTLALDFAAPNGIGDGIKDQEARFSGSLSKSIQLSKQLPYLRLLILMEMCPSPLMIKGNKGWVAR